MKRPFLKWAGAKTKIVERIRDVAPVDAVRFIEPFVGSGAATLNLGFRENIIADTSPDLIRVFTSLQRHNGRFIRDCERLFTAKNNSEKVYYDLRREFNTTRTLYRKAAIFIYLNRHCFNGLCRYNSSGEFNVPFGRYDRPYFPAEEMSAFHEVLCHTQILCADFREVIAAAGEGDFVYCDPPYVPISDTANFTAYSAGGFAAKDQTDLVDACDAAARRGAVVAVSNHDTPLTERLYAGATELRRFKVSRLISCDGENRNKANELMAVYNYGHRPLRGPLAHLASAV